MRPIGSARRGTVGRRSERGVALLIVLLVTALLIALIFEFSYGTRISLNSAVNFRDSQRALFLARSGITAFRKYGDKLRELIPEGEWGEPPMIGEADTVIRLKWEDLRGLININTAGTVDWVDNLFSNKGISSEVLDRIKELKKTLPGQRFVLLSELHAVMSDEDFDKVAPFLTVDSDNLININTASEDVLNAVLMDKPWAVSRIVSERKTRLIAPGDVGLDTTNMGANFAKLTKDSTYFRVTSVSTVGGYTKMVEAVFQGSVISYWRGL